MLNRPFSPTVTRRFAALLITILISCAELGIAAPASGTSDMASGTASIDDCGNLIYSGSSFGYLDNGTLSAGFCVGPRSIRRINVSYDKTGGVTTNVKLGYQQTNSSGIGIGRPVYASTLRATTDSAVFGSFYPNLRGGCYHGVMLNTITRYQYVTKVWGDC